MGLKAFEKYIMVSIFTFILHIILLVESLISKTKHCSPFCKVFNLVLMYSTVTMVLVYMSN